MKFKIIIDKLEHTCFSDASAARLQISAEHSQSGKYHQLIISVEGKIVGHIIILIQK